jgi:hypothetical protein
MAPDAERRARTFAEADDGAKESPCRFEVPGDDGCVVKLHDETAAGLFESPFWASLATLIIGVFFE